MFMMYLIRNFLTISQDFNHYPFLTYTYDTYIILTKIIIIRNCYRVTATQLTAIVPFCIVVIITSP